MVSGDNDKDSDADILYGDESDDLDDDSKTGGKNFHFKEVGNEDDSDDMDDDDDDAGPGSKDGDAVASMFSDEEGVSVYDENVAKNNEPKEALEERKKKKRIEKLDKRI